MGQLPVSRSTAGAGTSPGSLEPHVIKQVNTKTVLLKTHRLLSHNSPDYKRHYVLSVRPVINQVGTPRAECFLPWPSGTVSFYSSRPAGEQTREKEMRTPPPAGNRSTCIYCACLISVISSVACFLLPQWWRGRTVSAHRFLRAPRRFTPRARGRGRVAGLSLEEWD